MDSNFELADTSLNASIMLSNNMTAKGTHAQISQNSSYTAPEDGWYSIQAEGTANGADGIWYLDSNRTMTILSSSKEVGVGMLIPLKKGTTIYTRANYGRYWAGLYLIP